MMKNDRYRSTRVIKFHEFTLHRLCNGLLVKIGCKNNLWLFSTKNEIVNSEVGIIHFSFE